MNDIRRLTGIGLAWGALWLALWLLVGVIIERTSPGNVDPGELQGIAAIFGSMGFFSGLAFGVLLVIERRRGAGARLSWARAAGWGLLATAIVQLAYLNHGDRGVLANVPQAILYAAVGGLVAMLWLALGRTWTRFRSSRHLAT